MPQMDTDQADNFPPQAQRISEPQYHNQALPKLHEDDPDFGKLGMYKSQFFIQVLRLAYYPEVEDGDSLATWLNMMNQGFQTLRKKINDPNLNLSNQSDLNYWNKGQKKTMQFDVVAQQIMNALSAADLDIRDNQERGHACGMFSVINLQRCELREMLYPKSKKEDKDAMGLNKTLYNYRELYNIDTQRHFPYLKGIDAPPGQQSGMGKMISPVVLAYQLLGTDNETYRRKIEGKIKEALRHRVTYCKYLDNNKGITHRSGQLAKKFMNATLQTTMAFGTRQSQKISPSAHHLMHVFDKNRNDVAYAILCDHPFAYFNSQIGAGVRIIRFGGRPAWELLNENINWTFYRNQKLTDNEMKFFIAVNIIASLGAARGNMLHLMHISDTFHPKVLIHRPDQTRKGAMKNGSEKSEKVSKPDFKMWCKMSSAAPMGAKGVDDQIGHLNVFAGKHIPTVSTDYRAKIKGASSGGEGTLQNVLNEATTQLKMLHGGKVMWGTTDWKSFANTPLLDVVLPPLKETQLLGWTANMNKVEIHLEDGKYSWTEIGGTKRKTGGDMGLSSDEEDMDE